MNRDAGKGMIPFPVFLPPEVTLWSFDLAGDLIDNYLENKTVGVSSPRVRERMNRVFSDLCKAERECPLPPAGEGKRADFSRHAMA